MSKFPSALAQELYVGFADEERGSSSEGIGWAGLYEMSREEQAKYGAPFVVLVEQADGFVDYYRCATYSQAHAILDQYEEV